MIRNNIGLHELIGPYKTNNIESCNQTMNYCIICFENNIIEPKKCKICNVEYCNKCITKWLNKDNKCPHCRI